MCNGEQLMKIKNKQKQNEWSQTYSMRLKVAVCTRNIVTYIFPFL